VNVLPIYDYNDPLIRISAIGFKFDASKVPRQTFGEVAVAVDFVGRCESGIEVEISLQCFDKTFVYFNGQIVETIDAADQFYRIFIVKKSDRITVAAPAINNPREKVYSGTARIVNTRQYFPRELECFRIGGRFGGVRGVDAIFSNENVDNYPKQLNVTSIEKEHVFTLSAFCYSQILNVQLVATDYVDIEFPDFGFSQQKLISLKPGDTLDEDYTFRAGQSIRIRNNKSATKQSGSYTAVFKYKKPADQPVIIPGKDGKPEYLNCLGRFYSKHASITALEPPKVGYSFAATAAPAWQYPVLSWQSACDELTVQIDLKVLDVPAEVYIYIGVSSPKRIAIKVSRNETKQLVVTVGLNELVTISGAGTGNTAPPSFTGSIKVLDNTVPEPYKPQAAQGAPLKSGLIQYKLLDQEGL
jgi:hypothetical protein